MEKLTLDQIMTMDGQYAVAKWPETGEIASVRIDLMEYPLNPGEIGVFFSEDSREHDPWGPNPRVKDHTDDIVAGKLELYLSEEEV